MFSLRFILSTTVALQITSSLINADEWYLYRSTGEAEYLFLSSPDGDKLERKVPYLYMRSLCETIHSKLEEITTTFLSVGQVERTIWFTWFQGGDPLKNQLVWKCKFFEEKKGLPNFYLYPNYKRGAIILLVDLFDEETDTRNYVVVFGYMSRIAPSESNPSGSEANQSISSLLYQLSSSQLDQPSLLEPDELPLKKLRLE